MSALAAALLCPAPARAQEAAFVAAVRQLAAASLGGDTAGTGTVTAEQLQIALDGWDREIRSLESRAGGSAGDVEGDVEFRRRLELGLAYRRRGRLDAALEQFDGAAARQPGASDVHLLRALTLEAANKPADAARAFRTAWQRDAGNAIKAYLTLRRTPDLDAADRARAHLAVRDAYQRMLSSDTRPSAAPFLVLEPVPDGIARAPVLGDAATGNAFALMAKGRFEEAVAALRSARTGATAPDADSARARVARARAAETDGRLADARRDYAAALTGALAGRHVLHVGIGRIAQVEGETDAAIASFAEAVRLHPNDPVVHRECAAALVAADRADDAFLELVAALLIDPRDGEALAAIGQIYLDTDRPQEAVTALRRALQVKPDRFQTQYALGVALSRAGRADEAARAFARFEELSRESLAQRRRAVAGHAGPAEPAK